MKLVLFGITALASLIGVCAFGGVTLTTLAEFDGTNGASPRSRLVEGTNGHFYGTTDMGGTYDQGVLFRITPEGTVATVVSFDSDNSHPDSGIIIGLNGHFYGTTTQGGDFTRGSVYEVNLGGTFTNIYSFTHYDPANNPEAGLFQCADGSFIGTTTSGGADNAGSIFRLTADQFSILHTFDGTNGFDSESPLMQATDGYLYGVTLGSFGTSGDGHGCIFRITKEGVFTNLLTFNGTNGVHPVGPLLQATDGNLYGVTDSGGGTFGEGRGTVFRISTNGDFATVATFYGTNGSIPNGGLVEALDGNLYGTTENGGAYTNWLVQGAGTVYRVTPNGDLTTIFSFNGTNGLFPFAGLTLGTDGNFYGTTDLGGVSNKGNIFRLTVDMPAVFRSIAKSNGAINLTWSAISGRRYQLQYSDSGLLSNTWSNLGSPITASGGTVALSDLGPQASRFYRVLLLP